MAGHTEGPWWVQKDGITVCPPRPRGQRIICRAAECYMDRAEREANARLIAAAPNLLSIAKRWAALDGGAWHVERHAADKAALLVDTHAAIAQAEG